MPEYSEYNPSASVDPMLLAARLNEQKAQARRAEVGNADNSQVENLNPPQNESELVSLYRRVRREQKKNLKNKDADDKVSVEATQKFGAMAFSRGILWADGLTASVWGFIPGVIILNMFALGHVVMPEAFPSLGTAWVPLSAGRPGSPTYEAAKQKADFVSNVGLALVDLVTLLILISVLGLLVVIINFYQHPFQSLWDLVWGSSKEIMINLFK